MHNNDRTANKTGKVLCVCVSCLITASNNSRVKLQERYITTINSANSVCGQDRKVIKFVCFMPCKYKHLGFVMN